MLSRPFRGLEPSLVGCAGLRQLATLAVDVSEAEREPRRREVRGSFVEPADQEKDLAPQSAAQAHEQREADPLGERQRLQGCSQRSAAVSARKLELAEPIPRRALAEEVAGSEEALERSLELGCCRRKIALRQVDLAQVQVCLGLGG